MIEPQAEAKPHRPRLQPGDDRKQLVIDPQRIAPRPQILTLEPIEQRIARRDDPGPAQRGVIAMGFQKRRRLQRGRAGVGNEHQPARPRRHPIAMHAQIELHDKIGAGQIRAGQICWIERTIAKQKTLHHMLRVSYLFRMTHPIPKAALITGAARRLGRATALALAGQGYTVAIHYHQSRADAETLAAAIAALGGGSVLLQADLAVESEVQALFPAAQAALGPIGILVNNASCFERDEWFDATRASWDAHFEPNLRAPFVLSQHFAQALPESAHGLIINLLDQRVWSLTPHFMSYTLTKAALWTLTQTLALALAPRIRVNGIGPGPALPSPRQTEAQFARQAASVPLRHATSPGEVAQAVLALLHLPSVTGQMLALDGGQHLQWSPTRSLLPPEE